MKDLLCLAFGHVDLDRTINLIAPLDTAKTIVVTFVSNSSQIPFGSSAFKVTYTYTYATVTVGRVFPSQDGRRRRPTSRESTPPASDFVFIFFIAIKPESRSTQSTCIQQNAHLNRISWRNWRAEDVPSR